MGQDEWAYLKCLNIVGLQPWRGGWNGDEALLILCQGASGGTCCLKTDHNMDCFGERCHCVCDMFPSSLQGRNYKNTQAVSASLRAVSTGSDSSAWWLSCKYIKMQGFQALLVRYYCTYFKQKHFPFSPPWTGEAFRWEVSLEWCW